MILDECCCYNEGCAICEPVEPWTLKEIAGITLALPFIAVLAPPVMLVCWAMDKFSEE